MDITALSKSTGDYLKGLYTLDQMGEPISTNALAALLDVKPASVTNMLKRLAGEEPALVAYTKHYGATLTPAGRNAALRLLRRHRLVELFLVRVLGYTWDEIHAEAEELEHVISQHFEDSLADLLGEPDFDPHGDPIPNRDLLLPAQQLILLSRLPIAQTSFIRRVAGKQPEMLQHLGGLGLLPGVCVEVMARNPFDQTVRLRIGEKGESVLGHALASAIWVEPA
jgi:DtxR family Mn-dependent transcriptional regulator